MRVRERHASAFCQSLQYASQVMASSDGGEYDASLAEIVGDAPILRADVLQRQARDLGADNSDAPIMKRLVLDFLDNCDKAVPTLVQAVASEEWANAASAAHQIKGGASHLGAMAMARASQTVEERIEREHFDQVRSAARAFPKLLADTDEQLREIVGPLPE